MNMQRLRILVGLVVVSFFGRAASAQGVGAAGVTASIEPTHVLRISSGDLVEVEVFDSPELSGKLRVDDHGMIALPLAGGLSVSGLTAQQAGQAVETKLLNSNILKEPHATVTILEYATQGVTILGEVKNPGVYPLLGTHSLLDLISAAGGVTASAGKAVTVTHRGQPDQPIVVKLETKPGSRAGFNVDVSPGDTIVVSRAGIVYVVGDVGRPGGFVIENNDRLTVLGAVALAQGTNRTAALNSAKVIRKTEDGREELSVPLQKIIANKAPDQPLADGDILVVPSSGPKNALREMESILPAAAGAAIYRVP
jgi:polysaccharide export outer membrane protein